MMLAKHHYAFELAKKGNQVYFLNPESIGQENYIDIKEVAEYLDLFIINHSSSVPKWLKFHFLPLYHFLIKFHIRKIVRKLSTPLDIIWSFDLGYYYPLTTFSKRAVKVFHPVDEPSNDIAIRAAKGADIIFSVTHEIINKYKAVYKTPAFFINHGIANDFLVYQSNISSHISNNEKVRIGLSGNFLRVDLDRICLLEIIENNPDLFFEFFGSYRLKDTNISGDDSSETINFINKLLQKKNVVMHGVVDTKKLVSELNRMSAFLICYDVLKDQSKGTNYHKVMEYLSTGKVIISNNITTYQNQPELVTMVQERDNNIKLPSLFRNVILNINDFNSPSKQNIRQEFAENNTYSKQIERIYELILSTI